MSARWGWLLLPALLLAARCTAARRAADDPRGGLGTTPASAPADLDARALYSFDEAEVDQYLRTLSARMPELRQRVVHLGRKNIGQPYQIYLLGEFPFELYDPDPLYCLGKSDCVTFCEHTYAMALGHDWGSFFRILQRIRYKDGVVGMLTRNHYTESDWDRNNAFLFDDLTQRLGGGSAWAPMRELIQRAKFFAKFGIGQDIPDEHFSGAYIPKENVRSILPELRDADFVNIIRGDAQSQWAGHTGLIALAADGTVDFLHSAAPAVREQPLMDYLEKDKRCVGIKILRLRDDAQTAMDVALASSAPKRGVVAVAGTSAPNGAEVSSQGRKPLDNAVSAMEPQRGESTMQGSDARGSAAPPGLADSGAPDSRGSRPWLMTAAPDGAMSDASRTLVDYTIGIDTPLDPGLQSGLQDTDRTLCERFEIADDQRACGVVDLTDLRLAMVRPDEMFYGASVPKIAILLAYFETHPEAATELDARVERELGLMIKRSDNELAAKYGLLVGLDAIQSVLESDKYKLYDRGHGGGLWCGKPYGVDQPRRGDPLHDHSHGATVRQCLRYYLMMEQGKLVSPAASAKMKAIFASPLLEFHPHGFVEGLRHRDVTLIRKSGEWEDWHLDTARIEHGERVYLLAAMTHHSKGQQYLAELAAQVDELLCGPSPRKPYRHELIVDKRFDAEASFYADPRQDLCEAPAIGPKGPFNEVLVSWNIDTPAQTGFRIELRVGRRDEESWSPWLYVGGGGDTQPDGEKAIDCPQGRIDVDWFRSEERYDRLQYRVTGLPGSHHRGTGLTVSSRVHQIAVCCSDTTGLPTATHLPRPDAAPPLRAEQWQRRLPVPFRSQKVEDRALSGQICSPTSVAMVLAYRGVDRPTLEVAQRIYDAEHKIYGNWPRAVQAAFSYGVPGYLARFSDWDDVKRMIALDQPLIVSIRAKAGELAGAPYKATDGHLLVITGFDHDGNVEVNDPACATAEQGQRVYRRDELEKVWMRNGGTAYILLPR